MPEYHPEICLWVKVVGGDYHGPSSCLVCIDLMKSSLDRISIDRKPQGESIQSRLERRYKTPTNNVSLEF